MTKNTHFCTKIRMSVTRIRFSRGNFFQKHCLEELITQTGNNINQRLPAALKVAPIKYSDVRFHIWYDPSCRNVLSTCIIIIILSWVVIHSGSHTIVCASQKDLMLFTYKIKLACVFGSRLVRFSPRLMGITWYTFVDPIHYGFGGSCEVFYGRLVDVYCTWTINQSHCAYDLIWWAKPTLMSNDGVITQTTIIFMYITCLTLFNVCAQCLLLFNNKKYIGYE